MARMAEIVASRSEGDVLVGLGLGSCIGLVLAEPALRTAALAHIVLPASAEAVPVAGSAGKFADTAIPAMLQALRHYGIGSQGLFAVMVGGAQMFATGGSLDIGTRNERAVRAGLLAAGIPLRAAVTGGSVGRTVRVHVGRGSITAKEAGGAEIEILPRMAAVAA
jgi:chemotaxis protein CheD